MSVLRLVTAAIRAQERAAEAERARDLTAAIAVTVMGKLTDEQLEELRGELEEGLG